MACDIVANDNGVLRSRPVFIRLISNDIITDANFNPNELLQREGPDDRLEPVVPLRAAPLLNLNPPNLRVQVVVHDYEPTNIAYLGIFFFNLPYIAGVIDTFHRITGKIHETLSDEERHCWPTPALKKTDSPARLVAHLDFELLSDLTHDHLPNVMPRPTISRIRVPDPNYLKNDPFCIDITKYYMLAG